MMGELLYTNLSNATMNALVSDMPGAVDHINRAVSELEAEGRIVRCVKSIDGRAPRLHFSLA
jgi:hypothetical protein